MKPVSTLLVTFLSVANLASALPSFARAESGHVSVKQVRNPLFSGRRNGALALYKAYRKYGAKIPAHLQTIADAHFAARKELNARSGSEVGNGTASPETGDVEYLTHVNIGTPPQSLPLDFDTGSSDLWVFSSETPKSERKGHQYYNVAASSSAQLMKGYNWSITYGDGSSSSGDVYTDVVSLGGVVVKNQAVESALSVSDEFIKDSPTSGLLGLGFEMLNTVTPSAQPTFFDNSKDSLSKPVFTADLKHGEPGTYNFGFIDSSAHSGNIYYAPVDKSEGWWSFTATGYSVGDRSLGSANITGIADTGTTIMLLDDEVAEALYAEVEGASYSYQYGGYVFSCDTKVPDFSFGVGSGTITIPGEYLNFGPADDGNETCYGGLQSNAGLGINVFGDVALKAAFVVFDEGNMQLGWAAKDL